MHFVHKLLSIICALFGYRIVLYKNNRFELSSTKIFVLSLITVYIVSLSYVVLKLIFKLFTTKLTTSIFTVLISQILDFTISIVSWLSDAVLFAEKKVMLFESRLIIQNSLKLDINYKESVKIITFTCVTFFTYSLVQTMASVYIWGHVMEGILEYISTIAVDLILIQFVADNYFNYVRLKAMNSKMEKENVDLMLVIDGYQKLIKNIDCIVASFSILVNIIFEKIYIFFNKLYFKRFIKVYTKNN